MFDTVDHIMRILKDLSAKDLSGSYSLNDIEGLVSEFNSLQPQEDKKRGIILFRLCGATLIRHVFLNRSKLALIPQLLILRDLREKQITRSMQQTEYVRKYEDDPPMVCDIRTNDSDEYLFIITGYKHLFKDEGLLWRLPVKRIVQLQLDETDRITGLSKYVDLKIIF